LEIMDQLTDEILHFFNRLSSWESSVVRGGDLTVAEVHAIEILGQYGTMNMKELARNLGVTTGTTTVTVDRLEKKNYASRQMNPEDRRVNMISLTEEGKKAYQEHHYYHQKLTEQMFSVLSREEAEQFLAALKKINSEII